MRKNEKKKTPPVSGTRKGQYWTVRSIKGDNSSLGYLSGGVWDKAKAENCRSIFDIDRHYQGQPDTATR